MLTNSERQSRRYRPVLWLTIALCLASCSTQKQAARDFQEQISEQSLRHLDSLVKARLSATFDNVTRMDGESLTELVLFDTDKPPVDSTGQPPVKAMLRQRNRQQLHSESHTEAEQEQETKQTEDTTESREQSACESEKKETVPSAGNGMLKTGIGLVLAAVALLLATIVYKRLKT